MYAMQIHNILIRQKKNPNKDSIHRNTRYIIS